MLPQVGKFLIGVFAGLCAIFVPRIVTELSAHDPSGELELFTMEFIVLAALLAVFLGGVVMILKWRQVCHPPEIFMAALGVPALLAGAFNMSVSVDTLSEKSAQIAALSEEIARSSGIETLQPDALTIFEIVPGGQTRLHLPGQGIFIRRAFAAELNLRSPEKRPFDPLRIVKEKQYFVVLEKYDNAKKAFTAAEKLKAIAPNAVVVRGDNTYYVLEGATSMPLSSATVKALQLQRQKQVPIGNIGLIPAPEPKK
jgi:hypothetical protein